MIIPRPSRGIRRVDMYVVKYNEEKVYRCVEIALCQTNYFRDLPRKIISGFSCKRICPHRVPRRRRNRSVHWSPHRREGRVEILRQVCPFESLIVGVIFVALGRVLVSRRNTLHFRQRKRLRMYVCVFDRTRKIRKILTTAGK